jgi:hypothetical protein
VPSADSSVTDERVDNATLSGKAHRRETTIAGTHPPELGEIVGYGTGPRTDVEDSQIRLRKPARKQSLEQCALAGEPPVVHLDIVHFGQLANLHRRPLSARPAGRRD